MIYSHTKDMSHTKLPLLSQNEKEIQLLAKVVDIMSRTEGTSVCRAL